ncbi:ovomucoid-like isoform X2 [Eptesicus fuscus]|uniref:ovomucoid-like isoform X2 n=1 Tax=Eptesicus fuscus TaxID=29078 RepID=UPI002404720F|nr:ovomucoid-like isoform X2 [Eptesicus fuscus]
MKATDIFGEIPQKGISCSHYQLKSVQRKRVCSIRVSPLCASNNVTYPNSCVYCFANMPIEKFILLLMQRDPNGARICEPGL